MEVNESGNTSVGLSAYKNDAELAAVQLFVGYPDELLMFAFVACLIFMLIGIPGNLITVIALAKCKKVRNATAIFIINLSCSDLLFCCFILPLAASTFWHRSWPHGKFLCQMFPFARYALVAVSLLSVLYITVNRYIMISHANLYGRIYTTRNICFMIAFLWMLSFGTFIPTALGAWGKFSLDEEVGSCSIVSDEHGHSPKKFLFATAFALPSIAIILCYLRIWWIVRKATKQSRQNELRPREMKNFSVSMATIGTRSEDLDKKRPSKHKISKLPMNCFLQSGAELSSSDSFPPDPESRHSTSEVAIRALGNEPKNFRQSFIATVKWNAVARPRLPTKKDKKLLTMIVAIMVAFCACHLPITLTKTVIFDLEKHPVANILGYVLIFFTTCVNPVIYVVMSNEYRQAYKNLVLNCGR